MFQDVLLLEVFQRTYLIPLFSPLKSTPKFSRQNLQVRKKAYCPLTAPGGGAIRFYSETLSNQLPCSIAWKQAQPYNTFYYKPTGYYVYAEASFPANLGLSAVLTSKEFPPSKCRCISWSYHMFGSGIGALILSVQPKIQTRRILWNRLGEQGTEWITGETTIANVTKTPYKVSYYAFSTPFWLVVGIRTIRDSANSEVMPADLCE